MNRMYVRALILLLLATCSVTLANPFGIEKGMSLADVGEGVEIKPGIYQLKSVPKPHSSFESYIVRTSPECGIYWIKAIGKSVNTSVYGSDLKNTFLAFDKKLTTAYGERENIDRLLPNSIWDEANDWMRALQKKERVLMSHWSNENGSTLPKGMQQIFLDTKALSTDEGYIVLEYYFDGFNSCEEEIQSLEDDNL